MKPPSPGMTLHPCPCAVIVPPAGVVPACASLDCLTVFARSVGDGTRVMQVMEAADAGEVDVWRRLRLTLPGLPQQGFRFGVPSEQFTEWDGPGERGVGVDGRPWGVLIWGKGCG